MKKITKNLQIYLNEDNLKSILNKYVMPKHKDIRYTIYKSKTTDSYYVQFWLGRTYTTARISNHHSKRNAKGIIINEKSNTGSIVKMFEERIIALKIKRIERLYEVIERK